MSAPLSERLHAAIAQRLFDEEQRRAGLKSYPLGLTTLHGDLYALASALMDAISPLIAEAAAYDWPTAAPCPHRLGSLPCRNPEPHKGGGLGCVHDGLTVTDRHDETERRATA